ncbi:MAG: AI-2E family transporter [Lachnospiraceae bacterium]|nr:AI-2E family transporter [Lachnospiraceae bacterium]
MKDLAYRKFLRYGITVALLILAVLHFETIIGWGSTLIAVANPLIVGCVIAYILNILMVRLEKIYFPNSKNKIVLKSRRGVCMVLSLTILVLVVFFVLYLVIPQVVECIVIISKDVPVLLQKIWDFLVDNSDQIPALQEQLVSMDIDWGGIINKVTSGLMTGTKVLLSSSTSIVGYVFGAVTNAVIALIFSMYVLACKEEVATRINRVMKAFMKSEVYNKTIYVLDVVHKSFSNFFVGQATEAVILGTLCTIGMLIIRIPYAGPIGALVGLTALIPVFGGYIGAALGAFMILTVDPKLALVFIIYLLILQQLEGNLIYPRVVGSSIGLPGIWVLAAIMIGSGLGGVVGMLVGVPVSAAAYKLLRDATTKKLQEKGIVVEAADGVVVQTAGSEKHQIRNTKKADDELKAKASENATKGNANKKK